MALNFKQTIPNNFFQFLQIVDDVFSAFFSDVPTSLDACKNGHYPIYLVRIIDDEGLTIYDRIAVYVDSSSLYKGF